MTASAFSDDDDLLAAEVALGLLVGDERNAADSRLTGDLAFAERVRWWSDHFALLADEGATEPSASVWPKIVGRLGANDNAPALRRWRLATGGMGALAAALLAIVILRPDPVAPPVPVPSVAAPMVASLSGKQGMAVTVAYEASASRLVVTPVVLDPGKGDAELWIIPAGTGAVPVSLGVVDATTASLQAIDAAHRRLLLPGATFAITQEASGGSPTGAPQGPIVASGKILRV